MVATCQAEEDAADEEQGGSAACGEQKHAK
jgi:hypothetical protein